MSNDTEAGESAESADADEADDEEAVDGLQDGDFVEIAYTARTVEDGTLVDTTYAEVAEEEGVGEDQEFGPRTIVLGEGHIFGPIEDDLIGKEVGDEGTVVVSAAESFGEYEDEQVRTVSKDKIPEDDRYPGAQVRIDNQQGFVETIVGGRARVDFNHPLAGEDVEYEYEILDVVENREERARGLFSMFLDVDLEVWFQTDTVEEEQLVEPDEDEAAGDGEADDEEAEGEETEDEEAEGEETEDEAAVGEETEDEAAVGEGAEGEEANDEGESDEETAEGDDGEADKAEPPEPEYETVEVEKESLYVEAVPAMTMNQQWMMQKQQIAQQLIDLLGIDRVVIQETIDGAGMGMPGMMGGMGGMGGGGIEEALEAADVDADDLDVDELAEELEGE